MGDRGGGGGGGGGDGGGGGGSGGGDNDTSSAVAASNDALGRARQLVCVRARVCAVCVASMKLHARAMQPLLLCVTGTRWSAGDGGVAAAAAEAAVNNASC